jgi:hypothetical protein
VESEFVSTRLTFAERRQFVVECDLWKDVGDFSGRLKTIVCDLAHDWGLFLECSLYRLAIVHFFGGLPKVCQRVELFLGQRRLGSHEVDLLDTDTLLAISSFSEKAHHAEHHFQRLLALSRKKFLQWINFYKQRIRFVTLVNSQ